MNKTRFLTIAVVALALLNIVSLVALWKRPARPPHPEGPRKTIIERLRFDAGQVEAYDQLIQQHRKDITAKEAEVQAAKQALYNLLKGDDFSAQDSLTAHIGQLQMDFERIHFSHFKDIKSLCKSEQIKDFDALAGELASYFGLPKHRKNGSAK